MYKSLTRRTRWRVTDDDQAFTALYQQLADRVTRYIAARVASTQVAEDLAAQTFLKVLEAMRQGKDGRNMHAWVFGIARHVVANFFVRMFDLANPNPAVDVKPPLGASSTIKVVTINGQTGQYVRGDYGANGLWDATAPVQTLAWRDGDVLYIITTFEQNIKISREDLIRTAESITP
jgi:hypothetical protein